MTFTSNQTVNRYFLYPTVSYGYKVMILPRLYFGYCTAKLSNIARNSITRKTKTKRERYITTYIRVNKETQTPKWTQRENSLLYRSFNN